MLIALAQGLRNVPKQPWTQILLTSWSYLFSSTSFSSVCLSVSLFFHPPKQAILSISACLIQLAFLSLSLSFSFSGCLAAVGNESMSSLQSSSPSLFFSALSRQRSKGFPSPPQSIICQRSLSLHPSLLLPLPALLCFPSLNTPEIFTFLKPASRGDR